MDSFELTKIAAAVLAALLLIFGSGTLFEAMHLGEPNHGKQIVGYELPKPEPDEASGEATADAGAPAEAAFDPVQVASMVESADAEAGKKVFNNCKACHSVDEGGPHKVGPALWGMYGRKQAAAEGYGYSNAFQELQGEWTAEEIAKFIHAPKEYAPGTKMVFRGIDDNEKMADLIAYLATLK